jgi:hypothetical protein
VFIRFVFPAIRKAAIIPAYPPPKTRIFLFLFFIVSPQNDRFFVICTIRPVGSDKRDIPAKIAAHPGVFSRGSLVMVDAWKRVNGYTKI